MNKHVNEAEALLVKECLSGSEDAWRDFYGRFVLLMRNLVSKHSRLTPMEIDDITQTAFLTLTTALHNFDGQHPLSSFVCLITERVLVDEMRKMSAAKRGVLTQSIEHHDSGDDGSTMIESPNESPDILVERFEQASFLRSALNQLDSGCRELLKLRYFKELPFNEIAGILGVAENTLNVRAGRCLNKLKTAYRNLEKRGSRVWRQTSGTNL